MVREKGTKGQTRVARTAIKIGDELIIWLLNIFALSVPDEDYSRNSSCALCFISKFYFNKLMDDMVC